MIDEIALRYMKQVGAYILHSEKNELMQAAEVEAESKWTAKEGQLLLATETMFQTHLENSREMRDEFQNLVSQEGANASVGRGQMKVAHSESIRQLGREGQEEIMKNNVSTAEYEKECLQRYEQLVEGLREMNAAERAEVMATDMEEFAKAFELQAERLALEQMAGFSAEDAVKMKFTRILQDLEGNWQREAKEHEGQTEAQLREHYESHIAKVQVQADAALSAKMTADEQSQLNYFQKLTELQAEEVEAMHGMVGEAQTNFVGNFEEVQASMEARRRRVETRRGDLKEDLDHLHTKRVKEVRSRFASTTKAKSDVEKAVMAKFRDMIRSFYTLQRQYHDEVEQLHQGQATALEKSLAEVAEESSELLSYVDDHAKASKLKQERLEREDWQAVLSVESRQQMAQLMPSLVKLWTAMEVPRENVEGFLREASEEIKYSPETMAMFLQYAARLEARLPILKVLTRREQLKNRFEQTRKKSANPSRLFTVDSSTLLKDEQELSNVCMELLQHDTQLKELIPAYEERFQELFMYNGRHYLSVIDTDSAELKQYLHSLVAAAGSPGAAMASPRGMRR